MARPVRQPDTVYELTITLRGTQPRIWRRFSVPGDTTLVRLHKVIQVVMGWGNCHLHEFRMGEDTDGEPDPDMVFDRTIVDEGKVRLLDFLGGEGSTFRYVYDSGNGWEHELKVTKVQSPDPNLRYPVCLAGERACPPEDCDGTAGYQELLKIIADPRHEQHTEMMQWLGGVFDPDLCDLAIINKKLKTV